jgi:cell division FtsZ-interacting protein ZapD
VPDDVRRAAAVRDQPGQRIHQSKAPLGAGQQQHAAIGTEPTAVERGGDLLAADRWQAEWQKRIVLHGGCGSLRLAKRLVQTPKSLNQVRGLHHARQRIPAMRMNKTG